MSGIDNVSGELNRTCRIGRLTETGRAYQQQGDGSKGIRPIFHPRQAGRWAAKQLGRHCRRSTIVVVDLVVLVRKTASAGNTAGVIDIEHSAGRGGKRTGANISVNERITAGINSVYHERVGSRRQGGGGRRIL